MSSESSVPERFTVGLKTGAWNGGGEMTVKEQLLSVRPGKVDKQLQPHLLPDAPPLQPMTHSKSEVRVLLGRIPSPVINTVVLIESADGTVAAGVPPWTRRRLLAALRTAGFRVAVDKRWFATGESDVRPWP